MERMVWKPRSADEMRRLDELAKAAVGFDAKRGDQVAVENVSFSSNAPEMKPAAMDRAMEEAKALLHSQPGLMRTAVMGLCGVLLVLFVLRPVAKQVTATLREPVLLAAGHEAAGVGGADEDMFAPEGELETGREVFVKPVAIPPRTKTKAQLEQQGIFEHVSEHIRREPAQSTRLLEAWIGTHEEAE
jgi:flagellar M-ring protein FliF